MAERAKSRSLGGKKTIALLLGFGGLALVFYFFPPFTLALLDKARAKRAKQTFQPREFAETFWGNDLQKSLKSATVADKLLTLIRSDRAAARNTYGRTAELGNIYYYFVRGTGRVTQIGEEEVSVVLTTSGRSSKTDIVLVTANVFGNAIRNATGLLDVNQFANSQDFNNVSHELNIIAETKVLSPFRRAVSVGDTVDFVGCAEIEDEDRDLDPLKIVPVFLEIKDARESPGVGQ